MDNRGRYLSIQVMMILNDVAVFRDFGRQWPVAIDRRDDGSTEISEQGKCYRLPNNSNVKVLRNKDETFCRV